MDGMVNKLRIVSLPDPDTSSAGGALSGGLDLGSVLSSVPKIFEVQINPEQITRNFSIKYHEPQTPGENGSEFQFDKVNPEELELRFILDGTGTVLQNNAPSPDLMGTLIQALPGDAFVTAKVAQLQTTIYNYSDEDHRTPFLMVNYGKIVFMGVLMSMSVNYNLFSPAGIPLRAEVSLSMKAHTPFKDSASLLSLLSPDLTRRHIVIGGENMPRICYDVYKDEKYYIEVAKANQIINFRNLKPGTRLLLPPIDKSTTS
jgi:Contractile injection system tube protein